MNRKTDQEVLDEIKRFRLEKKEIMEKCQKALEGAIDPLVIALTESSYQSKLDDMDMQIEVLEWVLH